MKFLVLFVLINLVAQRTALALPQSLPWPVSVPTFPTNPASTGSLAALSSSLEKFRESSPKIEFPPTRTFGFDQLFNTSALNTMPFNAIASFIQEFVSSFNASSIQNLLTPPAPAFRQLRTGADFNSIPLVVRSMVRSAFEHFGSAVNASFEKGKEKIESSFGLLNTSALSAIGSIENLTATSIQDIDDHIAKYNETVRSCVVSNASRYQEIMPIARDGAENCVHDKLNGGKAILEQGWVDIQNAMEGGRNLSETIQSCSQTNVQSGFNLGIVGCYISAVFNIRSETILLPIQMTRRFAEMDEYISSARADIVNCFAIITESIAEQSLNVTQTIANCLIRK